MIWFIDFYLKVLDSMIYQRALYSIRYKGTRFSKFGNFPSIDLPSQCKLVKFRIRAKLLVNQLKKIQTIAQLIHRYEHSFDYEKIRARRQDTLQMIRNVKLSPEDSARADANTKAIFELAESCVNERDNLMQLLKDELRKPFFHNLKFTEHERALLEKIEEYCCLTICDQSVLLRWSGDKQLFFGEDETGVNMTSENIENFIIMTFNFNHNLRFIRTAGSATKIDIDGLLRCLDHSDYESDENLRLSSSLQRS